jgi:cytochrome c
MDSFEWNKIIGAVLGTALFVFGLKLVGSELFAGENPEKPGYKVEVADAGTGASAGGDAGPKVSLGTLLAKADKDKGMSKSKACLACHDFTKGGPKKTGPNLWGIVGRGIASADFEYSADLKGLAGKNWDYETLDKWLSGPKAMAPGTKMAFGGYQNPEDRANVLAYLASLSDAPVAFPKP